MIPAAQAVPLGLAGAWLLGLSMGFTACTITCLPFMGTWVLGRDGGHRGALRDASLFLAGRVAAYGALGLLAGWLGERLTQWLASGVGNAATGVASCVAGAWLLAPALRRRRAPERGGAPAEAPVVFLGRGSAAALGPPPPPCGAARRGARLPPALLGASLSLTPCLPLGWLLAVCALSGSPAAGLGNGVAFGLGAAVSPLLLVLPLFGSLGSRLREDRPWLARWLAFGAGAVLGVLGVRRILMA